MKEADVFVGILLGAPGSGKGTQGAVLAGRFGIPTVSTGDLLRSEIAANTPLADHVKDVLSSGALVGDDLVNELVVSRMSKSDCRHGFLLDGYPRSRAQAEYLDRLLKSLRYPVPTVLHLDVPLSKLKTRMLARRQCPACKRTLSTLSGGPAAAGLCPFDGTRLITRPDDRPEAVEARLSGYEIYEREVVAYYRSRDYHRIDGDGPLEAVTARVSAELNVLVSAA